MFEVTIRIKGLLDKEWSEWLGAFSVTHLENQETLLKGDVIDQSALHGLFSKLRDLGWVIIDVCVKEK